MILHDLLRKATLREDLSRDEAALAIGEIMEGRATPAWIGAFLVAMSMKGETAEELTGAALALRARATKVRGPEARRLIDTCGTGGDGRGTFNISTAAALVVAAAGGAVAKHGNRAVSSRAGSADVLEALGVQIEAPVPVLEECLRKHGFAFLFAQRLHPAMRHAAAPRRELGLRTLFNLCGPLANPAEASLHLLGIYDAKLLRLMAEVLHNLGVTRALVVHARDGLDELSPCAETDAVLLEGGVLEERVYTPEAMGLSRAPEGALAGGDSFENAGLIRAVLIGEPGPRRDAVVLNAGFALFIAGLAGSPREGLDLAAATLDSGSAEATLRALRETLDTLVPRPEIDPSEGGSP